MGATDYVLVRVRRIAGSCLHCAARHRIAHRDRRSDRNRRVIVLARLDRGLPWRGSRRHGLVRPGVLLQRPDRHDLAAVTATGDTAPSRTFFSAVGPARRVHRAVLRTVARGRPARRRHRRHAVPAISACQYCLGGDLGRRTSRTRPGPGTIFRVIRPEFRSAKDPGSEPRRQAAPSQPRGNLARAVHGAGPATRPDRPA